MGQVLVTEEYLEDIGDAIRDSAGTNATYTPQEMGNAIRKIARSNSGPGREIGGYIRVTKNAEQDFTTERLPVTWQNIEINTTNGLLTLVDNNRITLNSGSYTVLVTARYQNWHEGNKYIYAAKISNGEAIDIDNINTTQSSIEVTSIMTLNAGESVRIDAFCDCNGSSHIGKGVAWTNLDVMIMNATDNTKEILNMVYPVGSIYMSVNDIDPATIFGGTWERISQGRFLIGVGGAKPNTETTFGDLNDPGYYFNSEGTGGQYRHKLTIEEMPSHYHTQRIQNASGYSGGDGQTSGDGWGGDYHYANETSNTGGDQLHNNMPPYFGVYMWKRIS